ncbi:hypothetical protein 3 [Wenling tombus-like virus 5]|uniref:hypothetical protein 3 n=1 Tax=Wenling tombus-like virus 5 TaxID=1923547 RepID=UPI00090ACF88|nr:hypothetical protein 3 [Wenling tombus-like virus 5]APG76596.1 hypothetical protein 3 [Wenling tombus-like virus 5]
MPGAKPKPQRVTRTPRRNAQQRSVTQQLQSTRQVVNLVASNANHRPVDNSTHRLNGSDYLGEVTTATPLTAKNTVRLSMQLSPTGFKGTRVSALGELYEKYRYRRAVVRYVPALPATVGGQLLAYVDQDPKDDPREVQDLKALRAMASSSSGAQAWNLPLAKSITMPGTNENKWYYTGHQEENPRLSVQGVLHLLQMTDAVGTDGQPLAANSVAGTLYLDWVLEFKTPQMNPELVAAAKGYVPDVPIGPPGGGKHVTLDTRKLGDQASSWIPIPSEDGFITVRNIVGCQPNDKLMEHKGNGFWIGVYWSETGSYSDDPLANPIWRVKYINHPLSGDMWTSWFYLADDDSSMSPFIPPANAKYVTLIESTDFPSGSEVPVDPVDTPLYTGCRVDIMWTHVKEETDLLVRR